MESIQHVYRILALAGFLFCIGCPPKEVAGQPNGSRRLIATQFKPCQKGEAKFEPLHEDVVWEGRGTTPLSGIYLVVEGGKIAKALAFPDTHERNSLKFKKKENTMEQTIEETKGYIGMWVTKDGYIRHELLPNFRYDEARGSKKSAYQGSYRISGNHIDYKDDTGFTADGEFREGILYHAGMVLYKEQ